MCGFFPVNLWRIYKAVEKLGGYDSVSTSFLFDYSLLTGVFKGFEEETEL